MHFVFCTYSADLLSLVKFSYVKRAGKNNAQINLEEITKGFPGLTPAQGSTILEACIVTLYRMGHKPGTKLHIRGERTGEIILSWKKKVTSQIQRAWKDQEEATEMAAIGISILLALAFTDYTVVERSIKTTGFDYWLGVQEAGSSDIFKKMARLEISGIFNGDDGVLDRRVKLKIDQTKQSDATRLPAFVFVIEFSKPKCKFVSRNDRRRTS